jgi:hypothetical protein
MTLPLVPPAPLQSLAKELDRDRRKLVVLVGAGVSIGATSLDHASWLGLLKHGVSYLANTNVITDARREALFTSLENTFRDFDLSKALQHAELVEQNLTTPDPVAFSNWLRDAFSNFEANSNGMETLKALRDLQQAGALLLTTNYDGLLSTVTDLPAVTWEEHETFLKVINGKAQGILHLHGHWERPSSVILGRSSYDRIAGDEQFQSAFRSLWMQFSWLYVGCGDGLDDPNLGRLLEWGKKWGEGSLPDYFLTLNAKAATLNAKLNKPANLVAVGFSGYDHLPALLQSLTPTANCAPFVPINENLSLFRSPSSPTSIPFPSYQEYLDCEVPTFRADAEVSSRLRHYGWAFVLDVASVGKTTLALRIATSSEQRNHPSYYLNLANIDAEEQGAEMALTVRRLAHPNALLVLDNAHYQPELVRDLWDQWTNHSRGSRLMIIGTKAQRLVTTAAAQDFAFFLHHRDNPAVEVRPDPPDLEAIVRYVLRRTGKSPASALPTPPATALAQWYRDFGTALGAFCIAARSHLGEFARGNWTLPPSAATDWVRAAWLRKLNAPNLANLLCLATFGDQRLEMAVYEEALPHPRKIDQLLRLGLVVQTEHGRYSQIRKCALREPSWGDLILAAQEHAVDTKRILFEAGARQPMTATVLSHRLRQRAELTLDNELWTYIALKPEEFLSQLAGVSLSYVVSVIRMARSARQPQLIVDIWEALESNRQKLIGAIWEDSLEDTITFLDLAAQHGRDMTALWRVIESDPERFAKAALQMSLGKVASFLDRATQHNRDTSPLWAAVEHDPVRLTDSAWKTELDQIAFFLDTAEQHGRDAKPLWEAVESDHERLIEAIWETPLGKVASFLNKAQQHNRITVALWEAIERDIARFATRAWETPLEQVTFFLDTAKQHDRDVGAFWRAFESDPKRFAERAWETAMNGVASFLDIAKQHGRDVKILWEALEGDPQRLAERVWETPLDQITFFLDTARKHGRDATVVWRILESNPNRFAERAWESTLDKLGALLDLARRQGLDVVSLEALLAGAPSKLVARVRRSRVEDLAGWAHHSPDELFKTSLSGIPPEFWMDADKSESFRGAVWIARRCARVGLEAHMAAIISTIIQRCDIRDFLFVGAFLNATLVISLSSEVDAKRLPDFLNSICTGRWLGWQYTNAEPGPIAAGLRLLATRQTWEVAKRFQNPSLGIRLSSELKQFSQSTPDYRSEVIQLLGCATLFGCVVKPAALNQIDFQDLARLPIETLPHRPDATMIEDYQLQLWLGLRAVVILTERRLPVPGEVLEQTLILWRSRELAGKSDHTEVEKELHASMIEWLELSLQQDGNHLVRPGAVRPHYSRRT